VSTIDFNKLTPEEQAAALEGVKQFWKQQGFRAGIDAAVAKARDWGNQAGENGTGYRNLAAMIAGIQPPKGL
jgi:hypothetical protein